jgi:RNA-directed DNA polymerase
VKMFDAKTTAELAKLLAVGPFEIDGVLSKLSQFYRSYRIPKSNGDSRLLQVPDGQLKLLQQKVKTHILDLISPLDCVHGGVSYRSVKTNAIQHVGKEIVFALDVKNFFPSVDAGMVKAIFEALGFGSEAAGSLAKITTRNQQLPQGAPTSTGLANLAMTRVDVRLARLVACNGFAYTRYVDDLTLSGSLRLLDFRRLIVRIVEEEGFHVNPQKLRTMHSGERQIVTGLVVNTKLNIPREQRREIRRNVLMFSRYGEQQQAAMRASVRGKLSWVSSVNSALAYKLLRRAQV